MFLKVCLLIVVAPSVLAGGYFLTKNFDSENVFGSSETYLMVKAQKPKTQLYHNQAKSESKLYENNTKKFRCVTNNGSSTFYDQDCEIYKLGDTTTKTPHIIDIAAINAIDRNKRPDMSVSDIKKDNFYLLKVDGYIFQGINNLTQIQLVDKEKFPKQIEFANLRVEAILSGGGKKAAIKGGLKIQLAFKEKVKSNLWLVKLTKKDANFSWNNSLKCSVSGIITTCDAWKVGTVAQNNKFSDCTWTQLTSITSSNQNTNLVKDNYFILDVHTRQKDLKINDTITFVNNNEAINDQNAFQVVSGIFGNLSSDTLSGQAIFVCETAGI